MSERKIIEEIYIIKKDIEKLEEKLSSHYHSDVGIWFDPEEYKGVKEQITELRGQIQNNSNVDLNHYNMLKNTIKSMVETNTTTHDKAIELENLLNAEIKDNNAAFDSMDKTIDKLKKALNEVAQSRIGWEEKIEAILRENYKFRIKWCEKALELDVNTGMLMEDQVTHLKAQIAFYKELLEKLESPKKTEKKEKMTDDEIMRFNEEFMAKINKRKVQPLEDSGGEDIDYEKWREEMKEKYPEPNCDNCWKKGNYDLFMCPTKEKCIPERDYAPKGPEPIEKTLELKDFDEAEGALKRGTKNV